MPAPDQPQKPAYGAPCNDCGRCCQHNLCIIAAIVLNGGRNAHMACPALEWNEDGTSRCGMVRDPAAWAPEQTARHGVEKMQATGRRAIGAGIGCDWNEWDEPMPRGFRRALRRETSEKNRARYFRAVDAWRKED